MKQITTILLIFVFLAIGTASIGIVWLRLETSKSAKLCGLLEDEREMVMREVQELRGQRSWALRPSVLASMVKGRLSMPEQGQTVFVSDYELQQRCGSRGMIVESQKGEMLSMQSYGGQSR